MFTIVKQNLINQFKKMLSTTSMFSIKAMKMIIAVSISYILQSIKVSSWGQNVTQWETIEVIVAFEWI